MSTHELTTLSRVDVEDFLYAEARLLDDHLYSTWLELFTEDAVYWVPSGPHGDDPIRDVSIVHDDRQRLAERVSRLESGYAYAQEPRSRTVRHVSNVRVLRTDGGTAEVESALIVAEWRRDTRSFHAARCTHVLRRNADGLQIARKKVDLVDRDAPLGNLSLLL